jgi:glycosyltransferase involved in cell wall biosynthesis
MRITILNWRDVRSPRGGGAERVTHEVARRLVERGHEVSWISSAAEGLVEHEILDGVEILRRGTEMTTRFHARGLVRELRPEVVLEEINTLPYLAPLWSEAPVVLYMNQLARDVWWYEAPPPVALMGWLAEPVYLQAYRGCDAITISRSSRDDLRRIGLRRQIVVVPMAGGHKSIDPFPDKDLVGRMVAIGRLAPSKRYDHAIRGLAELRTTHPLAELKIVGEGRDRERLERVARQEGVEDRVVFTGRVDETSKHAAIDSADVLVGTSIREGWGLTVTEAAARGVPSVVYDIPGFRDAVVNGRTGFVVPRSPGRLADGIRDLLADPARYEEMRCRAAELADSMSFDTTADGFESLLVENALRRRATDSAN